MLKFGLYSNGVYGRLDTAGGFAIDTAVVEAVTTTAMSLKKGLGSAGLYDVKLRGRPGSIRFLSQNFDVGPDDIAFLISGRLIAVLNGGKVYVFGRVLESMVRRSFWGGSAWVLSLTGAPWFQDMVSNALYQLLTMMPEPVLDSDLVQGCHYMTSFDSWEPVDEQIARLKAGRA